MRRNYIARCEVGATMAMQTKAWMTSFLVFVMDNTLCEGIGESWGHLSNKPTSSNSRWPQFSCHFRCCIQS
jgi:hypothetical protein